ncbi:MAG: hypothetical protein MUP81_04555 [Dehalococcoidia bacterium]|nr:hypothetical protein [Dehalococcoidia bacterium]
MKNLKIKGRDIVTLCILVACVWLLTKGIDTVVGYSLLAVVCGYFGIEYTLPRIGGKKNGGK